MIIWYHLSFLFCRYVVSIQCVQVIVFHSFINMFVIILFIDTCEIKCLINEYRCRVYLFEGYREMKSELYYY